VFVLLVFLREKVAMLRKLGVMVDARCKTRKNQNVFFFAQKEGRIEESECYCGRRNWLGICISP